MSGQKPTLIATLIAHKDHALRSFTEYIVPAGRILGAPHVRLKCEDCDTLIWNETLSARVRDGSERVPS